MLHNNSNLTPLYNILKEKQKKTKKTKQLWLCQFPSSVTDFYSNDTTEKITEQYWKKNNKTWVPLLVNNEILKETIKFKDTLHSALSLI